jgi:photosystem II stability/assembly factor-like uncharacterized protein
LTATASGLAEDTSAGLLVHGGDPKSVVTVNVSLGYVSVHVGTDANERELAAVHIPQSTTHEVSVTTSGGSLHVSVDGATVFSTRALPSTASGGVGLSANASNGRQILFRDVVLEPLSQGRT